MIKNLKNKIKDNFLLILLILCIILFFNCAKTTENFQDLEQVYKEQLNKNSVEKLLKEEKKEQELQIQNEQAQQNKNTQQENKKLKLQKMLQQQIQQQPAQQQQQPTQQQPAQQQPAQTQKKPKKNNINKLLETSKEINKNNKIILYYTAWCPLSRDFLVIWNKFKNIFENKCIIEEVICDENDNLEKCRDLNIEYVPHIKYQLYNIKTKSYGKLLNYKENKDLENLTNFVMKKFI